MNAKEVPIELKKAWNSTSEILLGKEVGEISKYGDYLKEYTGKLVERSSTISGKDVSISSSFVCKEAKIVDNEELKEYEKRTAKMKLNMNEVKDLDSILDALEERFYYTGNAVLGNSFNVNKSDKCIDASYVYNSKMIYISKYVAYSTLVRECDYVFGSN
ncbi:MAG: hypothetical protein ABIH99_00515, partial [Candidatus Micrarchaeota archaeon]